MIIMIIMILFLSLPFLLVTSIINVASAYTPIEHFLLNCGTSANLTSVDGRSWEGDADFLADIDPANLSLAAIAAEQDPSLINRVPYMTARIILSQLSYTFLVSSGPKILRLYFYPATYSGTFQANQSFFAVTANDYTLLTNFNAFLAASRQIPKSASLVKEFFVSVTETQLLNVTFLPSANSFAFVNGIEVVSIPDNLYTKNNLPRLINSKNLYELDREITSFETLYRLNVGGPSVSAVEDTGMFREWFQDEDFLGGNTGNPLSNSSISLDYNSQTPSYSAPAIIYTTARAVGASALEELTWNFPVDSGFRYLLRLHFCEFMPYLINSTNQRVFRIFINDLIQEVEADIILWTGGTGIPIFRDYTVRIPNPSSSPSKEHVFLTLRPNLETGATYLDAILNGLEIYKLSSIDGNLAGSTSNSKPEVEKRREPIRMIIPIVEGAAGLGAIMLILGLLVRWRRRGVEDLGRRKSVSKSSWAARSIKTTRSGVSSPLPSHLCRQFTLREIKSATANFDDTFMIGKGGFGKVYRGNIDNDLTAVAIKRLDPSSRQGAREFRTEIEMLSKLRHVHLVSLIGYCVEKGEMILVYDYMANGTLRDHLYMTKNPPLPWKERLQICIGAARGLNYLHCGVKQNIIHRDVKSTNILLDEKWVAKVSDFGLSKQGPSDEIHSHVSTQVKGSFGYMDPEYYKKRQLTDKSDVYSFGVVLFEVLCARPAVLPPNSPMEQVNLAEWARRCHKKRTIDQIVDTNLKGQIAPECFMSYCDIAINCLKTQGVERPTMNEIVRRLESVLELQEVADKTGDHDHHINFPFIFDEEEGTTSRGNDAETILTSSSEVDIAAASLSESQSGTRDEGEGLSSSIICSTIELSKTIFSEIMDSNGR